MTKDAPSRLIEDKFTQTVVLFDEAALVPQRRPRRRGHAAHDDVADLAFGMTTHDMDDFCGSHGLRVAEAVSPQAAETFTRCDRDPECCKPYDRHACGRLKRVSATRSLETYPKDRGMSGEDRGCPGILFFDNGVCMPVRSIISYSCLPDERERAPSLCVGLANQRAKREGKPVRVESDGVTPASTWLVPLGESPYPVQGVKRET